MLYATGVAGRPNSYFRREDISAWAERWGVPRRETLNDTGFNRDYLSAMLREGRAGTDVFGVRIMWRSIDEARELLRRALGASDDLAALFEQAFGPTMYIHLSRQDQVAQAVSRMRAEQSGIWHLSADGGVLEGALTPRPIFYDEGRVAELIGELRGDDEAWHDFFERRRISPLKLTYEKVTADPQAALSGILAALGLDPELGRNTPIKTAKMADLTSRGWIEQFRKSGTS